VQRFREGVTRQNCHLSAKRNRRFELAGRFGRACG
jgi:hypothetical protein